MLGYGQDGTLLQERRIAMTKHDHVIATAQETLGTTFTQTMSYTYDARGKSIAATRFNADGSVNGRWTTIRNAAGKEAKDSFFDATGNLTKRSTFTYDNHGT